MDGYQETSAPSCTVLVGYTISLIRTIDTRGVFFLFAHILLRNLCKTFGKTSPSHTHRPILLPIRVPYIHNIRLLTPPTPNLKTRVEERKKERKKERSPKHTGSPPAPHSLLKGEKEQN